MSIHLCRQIMLAQAMKWALDVLGEVWERLDGRKGLDGWGELWMTDQGMLGRIGGCT